MDLDLQQFIFLIKHAKITAYIFIASSQVINMKICAVWRVKTLEIISLLKVVILSKATKRSLNNITVKL